MDPTVFGGRSVVPGAHPAHGPQISVGIYPVVCGGGGAAVPVRPGACGGPTPQVNLRVLPTADRGLNSWIDVARDARN
jgi:hypothetical protein